MLPFPIREFTTLGIQAGPGIAMGTDDEGHFRGTFAHAVGHALGLGHARCGTEAGPREWPWGTEFGGVYRQGSIGHFGFDLETQQLKDPAEYTDVMGYCPPMEWLSPYSYRKVLDAYQKP